MVCQKVLSCSLCILVSQFGLKDVCNCFATIVGLNVFIFWAGTIIRDEDIVSLRSTTQRESVSVSRIVILWVDVLNDLVQHRLDIATSSIDRLFIHGATTFSYMLWFFPSFRWHFCSPSSRRTVDG